VHPEAFARKGRPFDRGGFIVNLGRSPLLLPELSSNPTAPQGFFPLLDTGSSSSARGAATCGPAFDFSYSLPALL